MPELPEVESTARYLKERILGDTVTDVAILWQRSVAMPSAKSFKNTLVGSRFVDVTRRGKFVVCQLETRRQEPCFLLCHLRMSGSLDVIQATTPAEKHDRIILTLGGSKTLRFHDTRKFGRMYLLPSPEKIFRRLGVEPLSDDFTPAVLSQLLKARRGMIKPFLLNQRFIAGLGNIYVDEALWLSGIHPRRLSHTIRPEEAVKLHGAIRSVLKEALSFNGTDFGDGVVTYGMYTPKIYGRDDDNCERCRQKIVRLVVGQRGTHVCLTCQPIRRSTKRR